VMHPWQQKLSAWLRSDENRDRNIIWIYSVEGETGKTAMTTHLVQEYGAFVASGAVKELRNKIGNHIAKPTEDDDPFRTNPIFVIDIDRTTSEDGDLSKICKALEKLKGKIIPYDRGQVELEKHPHVVVVANARPDITANLTPERWFVRRIDKDTMSLGMNLYVEKLIGLTGDWIAVMAAADKKESETGEKCDPYEFLIHKLYHIEPGRKMKVSDMLKKLREHGMPPFPTPRARSDTTMADDQQNKKLKALLAGMFGDAITFNRDLQSSTVHNLALRDPAPA